MYVQYVPWYTCTNMVPLVPLVPWYERTRVRTYNVMSQLSVRTYHTCVPPAGMPHSHTCVPWYVRTYTCTYTTLFQKRLEIQAIRCNGDTSGRCQHMAIEDITVEVPTRQRCLQRYTCTDSMYRTMVPWYSVHTRVYVRTRKL